MLSSKIPFFFFQLIYLFIYVFILICKHGETIQYTALFAHGTKFLFRPQKKKRCFTGGRTFQVESLVGTFFNFFFSDGKNVP